MGCLAWITGKAGQNGVHTVSETGQANLNEDTGEALDQRTQDIVYWWTSSQSLQAKNEAFKKEMKMHHVPSGNVTYLWKDPPFFMGKLTISMAIFHSYVTHYQRVLASVRDENATCHYTKVINSTVIHTTAASISNESRQGWTRPAIGSANSPGGRPEDQRWWRPFWVRELPRFEWENSWGKPGQTQGKHRGNHIEIN